MWLFLLRHDFNKFEMDTGWREYWVFTGMDYGWKHRSQILSAEDSKPIESKPLEREYIAPELDSDYGTPEYQQRQLANSPERLELKKEYKRLKKKPVTIRKTT